MNVSPKYHIYEIFNSVTKPALIAENLTERQARRILSELSTDLILANKSAESTQDKKYNFRYDAHPTSNGDIKIITRYSLIPTYTD